MIGVWAREQEREIAAEFFELFKTPWAWYHEGDNVDVVVASGPPPAEIGRAALIVYRSAAPQGDVLSAEAAPRLYTGGHAAGWRTAIEGRETVHIGYDLFAEIEVLLTRGQPPEQAGRPTLEEHIALLRGTILSLGIPLVEIPPAPAGYAMTACLTHDVDFTGIREQGFDPTTLGFLARALFASLPRFLRRELTLRQVLANWRAAASLPLVHLGWCRDFWREFDRYLEIEQPHPSTFFFIPFKGRPGRQVGLPHPERRAAAYELSSVRADIEAIRRKGGEAGLHGIDAWLDPVAARAERRRLADETGVEPVGHRAHWLCFNEHSPAVLDEAGFDYDSTCGFNETVGFKAGTCQVFRPPGVRRLLELPLHLQDVALFYPGSLGLSPERAWKACVEVLDRITEHGGVATVLWHTRSLSPERWWGASYVRLIRELEKRNAWFGTAAAVTEWFRARRQLRLGRPVFSGNELKIHLDGAVNPRPGLVLRIYRPIPDGPGRWSVRQHDVAWDGQAEVCIRLPGEGATG